MGTIRSGTASTIGRRELCLDIAAIKRDRSAAGRLLAGSARISCEAHASGKRRVLVTNAHPMTLAIKNEQVGV